MLTAKENRLMTLHHQKTYWVPSPSLDQNSCLYLAYREWISKYGTSADCIGISPGLMNPTMRGP